MITNYFLNDLPFHLSDALSKNETALNYFSSLDKVSQKLIVQHSETLRSKDDMDRFISSMDKGASIR